MASMSVKVPTAKVIKALEDKLATAAANEVHNAKEESAYRASLQKYFQDLLKKGVLEFESGSKRYGGTVEISYRIKEGATLPEEPTRDMKPIIHSYEVQEISNALSILRMTDDETVNASTFKSISKFL